MFNIPKERTSGWPPKKCNLDLNVKVDSYHSFGFGRLWMRKLNYLISFEGSRSMCMYILFTTTNQRRQSIKDFKWQMWQETKHTEAVRIFTWAESKFDFQTNFSINFRIEHLNYRRIETQRQTMLSYFVQ